MIIKNRFGIFKYLLFRNDKVWQKMSPENREVILSINKKFNCQRMDYLDANDYGAGRIVGGENWDSRVDRLSLCRGKVIHEILKQKEPKKVLEIGPGPGFYTKMICEHVSVREYVGVDVNRYFLDYLRLRLQSLSCVKNDFSFSLSNDDVANLGYQNHFDFIILISTVHHIFDRNDLFKNLSSFLKPGGTILCIDPSHYIIRVLQLLYKMCFCGYLLPKYYKDVSNLSTHSMCSYGEYMKLIKNSRLNIVDEWYLLPKKKLVHGHSWLRFVSQEIWVLLTKY